MLAAQGEGDYASASALDDSLLQDADMDLFNRGEGSGAEDDDLDDALTAALANTEGRHTFVVVFCLLFARRPFGPNPFF